LIIVVVQPVVGHGLDRRDTRSPQGSGEMRLPPTASRSALRRDLPRPATAGVRYSSNRDFIGETMEFMTSLPAVPNTLPTSRHRLSFVIQADRRDCNQTAPTAFSWTRRSSIPAASFA
jgi:hypothetical protein